MRAGRETRLTGQLLVHLPTALHRCRTVFQAYKERPVSKDPICAPRQGALANGKQRGGSFPKRTKNKQRGVFEI